MLQIVGERSLHLWKLIDELPQLRQQLGHRERGNSHRAQADPTEHHGDRGAARPALALQMVDHRPEHSDDVRPTTITNTTASRFTTNQTAAKATVTTNAVFGVKSTRMRVVAGAKGSILC